MAAAAFTTAEVNILVDFFRRPNIYGTLHGYVVDFSSPSLLKSAQTQDGSYFFAFVQLTKHPAIPFELDCVKTYWRCQVCTFFRGITEARSGSEFFPFKDARSLLVSFAVQNHQFASLF